MVTRGITKAITNLTEAHTRLGISPSLDANFFPEWQANFLTLTDREQATLDRIKQRYLYYADSGAITEGTVNTNSLNPANRSSPLRPSFWADVCSPRNENWYNLILLSPLLEALGLIDPPYQVRGEKYIRFELEDDDTLLDGLIDALLVHERLWLIVIESKRYGFSVRQALAQTLAYMAAAPMSPVFGLITTGEDYLFVKLDQATTHYALSDKFTLSTASGNELYTVAQVLKYLAAI